MPRAPATKVCDLSTTAEWISGISSYCRYLRLTWRQLIHTIETGPKTSNHDRVLRKSIEESILQKAANQDEDIDEAELKRRVFLEEASKKVSL